jgi:hypothetical protein
VVESGGKPDQKGVTEVLRNLGIEGLRN